MLVRDALLAYAHFLCIFALASLLTAELVILRKTLPGDLFRRLQLVDRWYGVTAGLVIASGLLRLNLGLKGADFYVHNPVFWTKMGLFLTVGLISIAPTVAYLHWGRRLEADGSIALGDAEYARVRGLVLLQVGVFLFIPLCAAFMARGL
jgi:putative membrane protein